MSTDNSVPFTPDFLNGLEWYDNSRLNTINGCKRKGMLHLLGNPMPPAGFFRVDREIGPTELVPGKMIPVTDPTEVKLSGLVWSGGLASPVGQGAHFGSCFHAAKSAFEAGWGKLSFEDRAVRGAAAFAKLWDELFASAGGAQDAKHTLDRGIEILADYLDTYQGDDEVLRPVDPELGFVVLIEARPGDPPFEPFYYVGRCDGVYERLGSPGNDWAVGETKTTSGGAERRLKSLKFDRQPIGYVHILRDVMGYDRISCFMGDVVGVMRKSYDCRRDFFMVSKARSEAWRRETLQIIAEWRLRKEWAKTRDPFAVFYKETEECFKYGQCPYYNLCDFGVNPTTLSDFNLDTWNPLAPPARPTEIITNDPAAKAALLGDPTNGRD